MKEFLKGGRPYSLNAAWVNKLLRRMGQTRGVFVAPDVYTPAIQPGVDIRPTDAWDYYNAGWLYGGGIAIAAAGGAGTFSTAYIRHPAGSTRIAVIDQVGISTVSGSASAFTVFGAAAGSITRVSALLDGRVLRDQSSTTWTQQLLTGTETQTPAAIPTTDGIIELMCPGNACTFIPYTFILCANQSIGITNNLANSQFRLSFRILEIPVQDTDG